MGTVVALGLGAVVVLEFVLCIAAALAFRPRLLRARAAAWRAT
jgi:hypothetical protein